MAFDLARCDSAAKHYDKIILDVENDLDFCEREKKVMGKQLDLERSKNAVWVKDNNFLKGELKDRNRKIRKLKVGCVVIGTVAVLELGYIGYKAISR